MLLLFSHIHVLLLRGTANTSRAESMPRSESVWVSSHFVLIWKPGKTITQTHSTSPDSCTSLPSWSPGLPPCASILVPIRPGYICRWDALRERTSCNPAQRGSQASRGSVSLLSPPVSYMDPLVGNLGFIQDISESLRSFCKLDLLLLVFNHFYLLYSFHSLFFFSSLSG